jgi:hypothetical protein
MTGSVGDAEDVVHDAFLGLTRARQAGTTITDPKAYLTTVVSRADSLSMAFLVLLEALSPVERAVLGRRRQSAGDREAAGPAVARHAAARRPAPPGPGPRRLDPAIRAVVNPGKLGHIGPVSDVARLPPAQNAQFRAPKYGHPANGDPVQNGRSARGYPVGLASLAAWS